jgi:hypothetical protein
MVSDNPIRCLTMSVPTAASLWHENDRRMWHNDPTHRSNFTLNSHRSILFLTQAEGIRLKPRKITAFSIGSGCKEYEGRFE